MTFRGKDLYPVSLLSLIAMFRFADQNLMAPNLRFWLPCGVVLPIMVRTFPRDEATLERQLADKAQSLAK